jgi:hypothetical protein
MGKRVSTAVRLAIQAAGSKLPGKGSGKKKLAEAIGVAEQSINKWTKIPRPRIMAVHRATGLPLAVLAPDLFK